MQWVDPFDSQKLCSCDWPWNARKAAEGWYTKEIKRLTEGYKKVFSDVLQDRTPATETEIYETP